jgi:secreted PhoX family phosphatase
MAAAAGAGMFGGRLFGGDTAQAAAMRLGFTERARVYDEKDHVAPGYAKQVLVRWGDPVVKGAPARCRLNRGNSPSRWSGTPPTIVTLRTCGCVEP